VFIENGISGITGLLDLVIVPIKSALATTPQSECPPREAGIRKIALREEGAGGISLEKRLFSGRVEPARCKAVEMFAAGRKIVLEGFPLEEIAAWCFAYHYRWRSHASANNAFILEPEKDFRSDAKEAGAKN